MNAYQLLKDVCGIKSIVCQSTMISDLAYYEGWHVTNEELDHMLSDYNRYNDSLWNFINNNKKSFPDELGSQNQTPLQQMDDGLYYGVVKIDFKRAFTNYAERVFDPSFVKILKRFYTDAAKLYLPKSAKKFLYNYTCTNLAVNLLGKEYLGRLRRVVYDDVLYVSKYMGPIIKMEVDGAYLLSTHKQPPVADVFGSITTKQFKWILIQNTMLIGKREDEKVTIKGLGGRTPNIFNSFLTNLVKGNNRNRDEAVDTFFYNIKTPVLDWAYKTNDGNKIVLLGENMNIEVDTVTNEDIMDIDELLPQLSRDKYLNEIQDIVSSIFELVG